MLRETLRQQSAILKAVFTPNSLGSSHLGFILEQQGLAPESLFTLPADVVNKIAVNLACKLSHKPELSFPLGVLCSLLPSDQYTDELFQLLNLARQEENSLHIKPFFQTPSLDYWYLCANAEDLMISSIDNRIVMLVNGGLLLKFKGRLTAYCLCPLVAKHGIFVPENFYSPLDQESRTFYKEAFGQGRSKITNLSGSWAIMRGATDREFLSEQIKACTDTLPESFPTTIGNIARKDYSWLGLEGNE